MPQYAKPLTLHKGVDNQIQFQFLNQEQKPVDITGKSITCRIINYTGGAVLLQKALTLQLPATGIAALELGPADIDGFDAQKCYYSLEIPVGEFDFPVFVDQNAGARGDLNIVNSVLPSFIPSESITIPTGQTFPNSLPNGNSESNLIYYTSVISTNNNIYKRLIHDPLKYINDPFYWTPQFRGNHEIIIEKHDFEKKPMLDKLKPVHCHDQIVLLNITNYFVSKKIWVMLQAILVNLFFIISNANL